MHVRQQLPRVSFKHPQSQIRTSMQNVQPAVVGTHAAGPYLVTNAAFAHKLKAAISTVYRPPSTVYCPLSTVYCLLSTVYCPLSTSHCLQSTVYCPLSTVHCLLSTVHSLLSTIYCPLSTAHCPLSTVISTVYWLAPLPLLVSQFGCCMCRTGLRPYRDAQDRLLWRDKTCPAHT